MQRSQKIPLRYIFFIIVLFCLYYVLRFINLYVLDYLLIYIGISFCLMHLICSNKKDIFDPFYLFSLHYCLVYISAIVLFLRGFENNVFLSTTNFYHPREVVYTYSLFVCIVSYVFAYFGYHMFIIKGHFASPEYVHGIKSSMFAILIFIFFCMGLFNFILLVQHLYGTDLISFFLNFAERRREFADAGLSTVGYHFMYAASYMLFIRWLFIKKNGLLTFFIIAISISIMASNSRVSSTTSYIGSFVGIYYYFNGTYRINKKVILCGIGLVLSGLLLFFLRIYSINQIYGIESQVITADLFLYLIFDQGNTVNFPIIMKIIDSWGINIGYLYGASLLYPFYGHISYDLFSLNPPVQEIIKSEFYSAMPGGNLPPTIIGELYANFSFWGIPAAFFAFGAFGALIKNILLKTKSSIFMIFYIQFSLAFYMIVVKGGFSNFGAFWMFVPCIIFYFSILLSRSYSKRNLSTLKYNYNTPKKPQAAKLEL